MSSRTPKFKQRSGEIGWSALHSASEEIVSQKSIFIEQDNLNLESDQQSKEESSKEDSFELYRQ